LESENLNELEPSTGTTKTIGTPKFLDGFELSAAVERLNRFERYRPSITVKSAALDATPKVKRHRMSHRCAFR
jgi:hypothetical protein